MLSDKVSGCGQDTKKLYSVINGLIGRTMDNPMPESESDKQLAEDFADYFMEKNQKDMGLAEWLSEIQTES